MPITTASPSTSRSTTTMHVRRVMVLAGRPKVSARSMTGTTRPRRFRTPCTHAGIDGTRVTTSYSMISLTRRMPTAYSSPPMKKLRYWLSAAPSTPGGASATAAPPPPNPNDRVDMVLGLLVAREVAVVHRVRRRGRVLLLAVVAAADAAVGVRRHRARRATVRLASGGVHEAGVRM